VTDSATQARPRQSIGIVVLMTLYMLGFTNLFLRNSLGIMAPSISQNMALSPATLSVVASSFFFAYALMQIPSGMLLDRFGARRTLAFLLLFTTAGAALFSIAENASQLIAARILMGIGCAGIFSGAFFVVNQWVSSDRVITQTALLNSFAAIGGLCATAPLAALLIIYDWRDCFWVFTIGVGILLLAVLLGLREPPKTTVSSAARHETIGQILAGVRGALAQPGMKRLLVVGVPISCQTTIIGAWGAPYLCDVHQLDDIQRGSIMLAMAVTGIFGHSFYGYIARLLNSVRTPIVGGGMIVCLMLSILAAISQPPIWLVTTVFAVLGFVTMYPMVAFAHARGLVPTEIVGRGVAVTNMGIMMAIALSQLLFGWIIGLYPTVNGVSPELAYRAGFAALAGLSLLAVFIYIPARDCKPRG
jgi:sugar phosphate permease